jgi:Holliday junction DNA helicase RuvA
MIALLTGKIAHKSPDYIIMDVNGVGYRVQIPFSTYYDLPEEGGDTSLQIYTHVKEDAINLYGFKSLAEKRLFQLLISVSGVGPKLATGILSNIQVHDLAQALTHGDLARLSAIPGIGKKTAERLVLELKEKARVLLEGAPAAASGLSPAPTDAAEDVTSALVNLGYKEALVKKILAELPIGPTDSVEAVLKLALKKLMK